MLSTVLSIGILKDGSYSIAFSCESSMLASWDCQSILLVLLHICKRYFQLVEFFSHRIYSRAIYPIICALIPQSHISYTHWTPSFIFDPYRYMIIIGDHKRIIVPFSPLSIAFVAIAHFFSLGEIQDSPKYSSRSLSDSEYPSDPLLLCSGDC